MTSTRAAAEPVEKPAERPVESTTASADTAQRSGPSARERLGASLRTPFGRGLLVALGVHVAIRLVSVGLLALAAPSHGFTLSDRLAAWDGGWFIRLATEGYPDHLDLSNPDVDQSTGGLAFFPVYPLLMRGVNAVTRMPVITSGVVISILAAAVAAAGIYTLGSRLATPLAGVYAVAVWSALPLSIVLTMVYTEALFTALAVWVVVLGMRERWLLAGTLALLAGLTRATGLALGVALLAGAVFTLVRRTDRRRVTWRLVLGVVMGLAGTPLWWLWVWAVTGRPDAWFAVQNAFWGSRFDFGVELFTAAKDAVLFQLPTLNDQLVVVMASLCILLIGVVLGVDLVLRARRDSRWLLPAAYAVAVLVLTIGGAGFVFSKMRFVLPIFPLVLPVAIALTRARKAVAIAFLVVLTLAGAWWSTFMLVVWRSAI